MYTIVFKIENGRDVKVNAEAGANLLDIIKEQTGTKPNSVIQYYVD